MSQQCTPLWSPELYDLGVPPMWVAWVLLLWQADYWGSLVGMAGPSLVGCQVTGRHSWVI